MAETRTFEHPYCGLIWRQPVIRALNLLHDVRLGLILIFVSWAIDRGREEYLHANIVEHEFRLQGVCQTFEKNLVSDKLKMPS